MQSNLIARTLVSGVIIELTLATALIHLDLGGTLFTLNAVGYLALGGAYALAAVRLPALRRYGWLPRVGLAGYAAVTIGAYLVVGPYFALGWITKGIELAIIGLVIADLSVEYELPAGLLGDGTRERLAPGSGRTA